MSTERQEVVNYIQRYGGFCRDCADESGVCPSSGLPCAGSDKAIRHVLTALEYGTQHGYLPAAPGAAAAAPTEQTVNRATVIEWLDALDIEVTDRQLAGLFHAAQAQAGAA